MQKLQMWRLIADEGKLITNGTITGCVVDCAPNVDPDTFYEIDEPQGVDDAPEKETNGDFE